MSHPPPPGGGRAWLLFQPAECRRWASGAGGRLPAWEGPPAKEGRLGRYSERGEGRSATVALICHGCGLVTLSGEGCRWGSSGKGAPAGEAGRRWRWGCPRGSARGQSVACGNPLPQATD
eukprot:Gb_29091 [translate_table: standard]